MKKSENTGIEPVNIDRRMANGPSIVWFRNDLRLSDNPALLAAIEFGQPVICLYVLENKARPNGGASKWWLNKSLNQIAIAIRKHGGELILRKGDAQLILNEIVLRTGASAIFWNRRYDKFGMKTDQLIKKHFNDQGILAKSFKANLLFEPWEIEKKAGGYYKVYGPFKRACLALGVDRAPLPPPTKIPAASFKVQSDNLADWDLHPANPDWSYGISNTWNPGEAGARQRLDAFLHKGGCNGYMHDRNLPAKVGGTSGLSPHLAFGEISPNQVWAAASSPDLDVQSVDQETFLSQVLWREFSYTLLYFNPDLDQKNFQLRFDAFPWCENHDHLKKWQQGQTGFPIVDAGMRQLWHTGWMHNRVRMIVGSFLVKHMLLNWRHGEEWFWDTLVDADRANNAASWQWIAGSGADAAPYFRIFNPMTQGEKFDPKGEYIRRYVTELKNMPDKYLNAPWEAPQDVLKKAGVELGNTYPRPIVDHSLARERALSAFAITRTKTPQGQFAE